MNPVDTKEELDGGIPLEEEGGAIEEIQNEFSLQIEELARFRNDRNKT